jgi:hypothetical protein
MTDFPDSFDWANEDNIVLRDQPAVAIYSNRFQQVVIRCERAWDQEDDVFVLVDFAHAIKVAQAILLAAGQDDIQFYRQAGRGCQDVEVELPPNWNPPSRALSGIEAEVSEPKDKTAAERMRRYRNKHRNDRNGVTEEPELRLVAAE